MMRREAGLMKICANFRGYFYIIEDMCRERRLYDITF